MNTLITIATYNNAITANIHRGRLEAEAVPATLANEQYVIANWMMSNALGGIQLQVPATYAQAARDILKEIDNGEHILTEDDNVDVLTCPSCHSDNVKRRQEFWKISLLAFHLFAIPSPFSQYDYRCKSCKHQWSDEDQTEYPARTIILYALITSVISVVVLFAILIMMTVVTNF